MVCVCVCGVCVRVCVCLCVCGVCACVCVCVVCVCVCMCVPLSCELQKHGVLKSFGDGFGTVFRWKRHKLIPILGPFTHLISLKTPN